MADQADMIPYASMGTRSPASPRRGSLSSAVAAASLLLFIGSMLRFGWIIALVAATVAVTGDQSFVPRLPCVLGTIANVAYLIAWVGWWWSRPLSAVAALASFCMAIGSGIVMPPGSFRPELEYWLWLLAPAVLLMAAVMPRNE